MKQRNSLNSIIIQVSDYKKVIELRTDYPKSILEKFDEIQNMADDAELEFYETDEVSYFHNQPWILEDKDYSEMSSYELNLVKEKILEKLKEADIKQANAKDGITKHEYLVEKMQYEYMLDMLNKNYLDKTFNSNSTVKNSKK